jgi:glycosyltransferase involved in cell wall biosynthesis
MGRLPGGRLGRILYQGAAHLLRRWDVAAAARPDLLVANSTYTRDRIRRYYGRDAEVIEPPIDAHRFERADGARAQATAGAGDDDAAPFLVVSALVPYKRVDLAVQALAGRPEPLVIVGEGPERAGLQRLAGPNVTFRGRVSDEELADLYERCRALLHPARDDFGMVMVEALAAGKPVITCGEGGAVDIVRSGETGVIVQRPTVEALRAALNRFMLMRGRFDPARLRAHARRFDRAVFERRFLEAVQAGWAARDEVRGRGPRVSAPAARLRGAWS